MKAPIWIWFSGLICLGVLSLGVESRDGSAQSERTRTQDDLPSSITRNIRNRTTAFNVVDVMRPGDRRITLSLRNDYDENITAFVVGIGRVKIQHEIIDMNRAIRPGDTYRFDLVLPPDFGMSGGKGHEITILAVVFEDQSADGDPQSIGDIEDRRRGKREQLVKVQQLFDELLNSSSSIDHKALETLRSKIMSLREDGPVELSGQFKSGLHDVKEEMAREIGTIRDRPAFERINLRNELTKVRDAARNKIASLAVR